MAEIKLQKRYKYAGDIMPKLLDIGFDLETASDFLNSIPDVDVAPREDVEYWKEQCFNACMNNGCLDKAIVDAAVAREIFEEIEELFRQHKEGGYYLNCAWYPERLDLDTEDAFAELKKKYTEGQK